MIQSALEKKYFFQKPANDLGISSEQSRIKGLKCIPYPNYSDGVPVVAQVVLAVEPSIFQ
jgi:hypothetical protein